jgi:hypothetical protein
MIGISLRWGDLRHAALGLADVSARAAHTASSQPALTLALPAPRARRVLICGGSPRVPRVISELITFYGPLDVTVLVRERGRTETLVQELLSKLTRTRPGWTDGDQCGLLRDATGHRIGIGLSGGVACVRIAEEDWSDATRVARNPHVDLERTDVLLYLPSRSAARDSDGLVALGCLKTAHAESSQATQFPPSFRVLGVMDDPVKGDLLENRLDAMILRRPETTFTIICGERMRHWFTVQNVLVRGLSQVCLELLDAGRQGFCRVIPTIAGTAPPGHFTFEALAARLLDEHGVLLLGIEFVRSVGRPEVLLDPLELRAEGSFAWSDVAALHVLGDGRRMLD